MIKKRYIFLILLIALVGFVYLELHHERFGANPSGERLARIEGMPNYNENGFHNIEANPTNLIRDNYFVNLYKIHFDKSSQRTPSQPLPNIKTDLKALALDKSKDALIPLGHSSYYMQLNGINMLIDPVFTPYAAPFSFLNKAFDGTNVFNVEDLPHIDYIFISHDHYDHLDYDTMKKMQTKVEKVIAPLGIGAHLELWGYTPEQIWEGYWYDSIELKNNISVHIMPARHYSSRLFDRNKTLWAGFAFITNDIKIFYSGDTGYGKHFQEVAQKFGEFDLAILDIGQFNEKGWPHIHLLPKHAAIAAEELGAKRLLPAHNSKFAIALHDWKDPLDMIAEESKNKDYILLTPKIGEEIDLNNNSQKFSEWWKQVQ